MIKCSKGISILLFYTKSLNQIDLPATTPYIFSPKNLHTALLTLSLYNLMFKSFREQGFFAYEVQERLMEYGIKFRPIKPAFPNLNGKVERSQRTDLEELAGKDPIAR
jgi:hypothetical protein